MSNLSAATTFALQDSLTHFLDSLNLIALDAQQVNLEPLKEQEISLIVSTVKKEASAIKTQHSAQTAIQEVMQKVWVHQGVQTVLLGSILP